MANRLKFTIVRRLLFLDSLRKTGNVTRSASFIGMAVSTLYGWRERDPDLRAQWDAVMQKGWRRKFGADKQRLFLETLRATCNVTLAAAAVGMHRDNLYRWRKRDPEFRAEWHNAVEEAIDLLEAELHRRAFAGVDKPVVYQGEIRRDEAGRPVTVKDYSDGLAMFLMKAHRPERYRERIEARLSGGATVSTAIRLRGRAGGGGQDPEANGGEAGGDQGEDHDPGD